MHVVFKCWWKTRMSGFSMHLLNFKVETFFFFSFLKDKICSNEAAADSNNNSGRELAPSQASLFMQTTRLLMLWANPSCWWSWYQSSYKIDHYVLLGGKITKYKRLGRTSFLWLWVNPQKLTMSRALTHVHGQTHKTFIFYLKKKIMRYRLSSHVHIIIYTFRHQATKL